jgi:hypothetical protein
MAFYNTLDLSGPALEKAQARTASQETLVKAIFRNNPTTKLSPSQLMKLVRARYGLHTPLTSWRRCFTDLTKENFLIKCGKEDQVVGEYGEKENVWRYNDSGDTSALQTFFNKLQNGELEGGPYVPPTPKQFVQKELFA